MAAFTTALLVSAIAGTAISAVSQIKAGNAAKRAGEAGQRASESQAQLAEFNANVADLQAEDALARGAQDESQFRVGVRSMIGSQRANISASGVDVGFGSALDVQADAAMLGEQDALQIRTNAAREAWGYKVESADLRKRADIARKEGVMIAESGKQAQAASRWQAAGTIAGGTANALEMKYGFNRRSTTSRGAA